MFVKLTNLTGMVALFAVGFGTMEAFAQVQVTSVDELLERMRSENKEKPKVNCLNEIGFQLLESAAPQIKFPIGSNERDIKEQMSDLGFMSQNFLHGGRPLVVNSNMSCAQRMGSARGRFCRKQDDTQGSPWYVVRASFGGVEVSGKCVFGLMKPLEYVYHEPREVSLSRAFAKDPTAHFGFSDHEDWENVRSVLETDGWILENDEFQIEWRKRACERNRETDTRAEFLTKYEPDVALKFRIHLEINCENGSPQSTKVKELEPFL